MDVESPTFPEERFAIEQLLTGEALTAGYRPTLPLWALWSTDSVPQFHLLRDIELMLIHPVVLAALNYFKGGISGAEFDVKCDEEDVAQYALEQCQRFWDRGMPKIQGGYEYGWIAGENLFCEEAGRLAWDDLLQFSPRDVFLLTRDSIPVGVRVKQIRGGLRDTRPSGKGTVDLWMASSDVPAKGLWYAHNPRYSQFYGQSQLLGAWRPWRRLAWKDGAETVIDGGIYRFAYAGPVIHYPEEDRQAGQPGAPATTVDSQGRSRRFARDVARQMAELYKTGAGVGLPSTKYPPEMGGGDKWKFDLPTSTLNVSGLIEYAKWLQDQISYGVGVPPELLQASETGSGYSGRAIPLEGFLMLQQRLADAMLSLFVTQVLRPMIRWNWGQVRCDVKIKNLLETKRKAQTGESGASAPTGLMGEARQPGGTPPTPELPTGAGGPAAPYDPNWKPYSNPATRQQGWISDRGRVVYQQARPGSGAPAAPVVQREQQGFSLGDDVPESIRAVALKILQVGKVA